MTRMRRRRYRRRRRIRRALVLLAVVGAVALLMALRVPQTLRAEGIAPPTPTPVTPSYDREVVTREVHMPPATWYTIQTGVFSQQDAAQAKAGAYADRGAPGTVVEDGGKFRVFIASYGREEEAVEVRRRLGEVQRVETYLYAWNCPELRLRLTGMAGQLDVAEAGMTLLAGAGAILRDTATLLDAGQLTAEETLSAVAELDGQIRLWQETAHDRFGGSMPELLQQLDQRAQAWQTHYAALKGASASAMELSAALKGHGMQLYDDEICMRRAWSGQ